MCRTGGRGDISRPLKARSYSICTNVLLTGRDLVQRLLRLGNHRRAVLRRHLVRLREVGELASRVIQRRWHGREDQLEPAVRVVDGNAPARAARLDGDG